MIMKIVAIKEMAAGNESIGEMWQETKIFDAEAPILEVVRWAAGEAVDGTILDLRKRVTITVAQDGQ